MTVLAALVSPIAMLPKAILAGVTVVCVVPVPLKGMLCGLLLSGLSLRVSVPVAAPIAAAVKVTDTMHDLAGARVAPQVVEEMAKPLPLIPLPTLIAVPSWLVRMTFLAALLSPTAISPNARLEGATVGGSGWSTLSVAELLALPIALLQVKV